MYKLKERSQPLSRVIADSFVLLKSAWGPNLGIIIPAVVMLFLYAIAAAYIFGGMLPTSATAMHSGTAVHASLSVGQVVGMGIAALVFLLLAHVVVGALVKSNWNIATSEHASLGNAWGMSFKKIHVYLLKLIIMFVVIGLVDYFTLEVSKLGMTWLSVIVAIVLNLVGIYVVVSLLLVEACAVVDDSGFSAIGHSWRLVAKNWWRAMTSVYLSSIFYIGLFFFFLIVAMFFFAPAMLYGVSPDNMHQLMAHHAAPMPMWIQIIAGAFMVIWGIAFSLTWPGFISGNIVILHNDLKERKRDLASPETEDEGHIESRF